MPLGTGTKVALGIAALGSAAGGAWFLTHQGGGGHQPPPTAELIVNGNSVGPVSIKQTKKLTFVGRNLTPHATETVYINSAPTPTGATSVASKNAGAKGNVAIVVAEPLTASFVGTHYFAISDPTVGYTNWIEVKVAAAT